MEPRKSGEEEPPKGINTKNEAERRTDDKPAKSAKENVMKNEEIEPAGFSGSHGVRPRVQRKRHASLHLRETTQRIDSHSYICPLGIAKDVLVDVAGHMYLMDFVILNIREDEKSPFIVGIPFLTTTKAVIKFDKGTITLRSGKSKISFHRIPEPNRKIEKGIKNDIEPIAHTMTVNRLVLE
uniref:Reverse transcriptase domain-containing protein n=1 Tax=Tanacetum cinerariifolium TaxID=118510 RepID=A0A6L2KRR7_TANCI|nr:hypothetical protein [Tanacetum cinerariifolium]